MQGGWLVWGHGGVCRWEGVPSKSAFTAGCGEYIAERMKLKLGIRPILKAKFLRVYVERLICCCGE